MKVVLAIDSGTTGSTALVLDRRGSVRGRGYAELPQHFPRPGWVEHDGEEIWSAVQGAVRAALAAARVNGRDVQGIGITNQRETTLLWDRARGKPAAGFGAVADGAGVSAAMTRSARFHGRHKIGE